MKPTQSPWDLVCGHCHGQVFQTDRLPTQRFGFHVTATGYPRQSGKPRGHESPVEIALQGSVVTPVDAALSTNSLP